VQQQCGAAELVSGGAPLVLSMAGEVLKEPLVSPVRTKDFVNFQLNQKDDSGLEAAGIKTAGSALTLHLGLQFNRE
jgi:hypothetical protein